MSHSPNTPLPVDLQMDLLVDAELPERERRELLLAIDREPARWRELAIRFLERQVERQSIQQFVTNHPAPVETKSNPAPYRVPRATWLPTTIAAGLIIAVIAGAMLLVARQQQPRPIAAPVVSASNLDTNFFPPQSAADVMRPSKRSVVIQADGNGNAVVIPVNTLPMKFY